MLWTLHLLQAKKPTTWLMLGTLSITHSAAHALDSVYCFRLRNPQK